MVEDHKHCIVCGKAISSDRFFCSLECEDRFKQQQRRMSRMRRYMMLIFFVLLMLILLLPRLMGRT